MFTGSTKLPPTKTPQPERLDEVYAALRRGLQWVNTSQALFVLIPVDGCQVEYHWIRRIRLLASLKIKNKKQNNDGVFVVRSYLQVHQLELDSLGQQIRENKRNGRLVRCSWSQTSHTSIDYHTVPGWLLSSPVLSQDVNLTLCDAKCFYSYCLLCRGLYMSRIRWVSFTPVMYSEWHSNCVTKIFCISWSSLIIWFFFSVASESHREVYASLGIPSQQGVYVWETNQHLKQWIKELCVMWKVLFILTNTERLITWLFFSSLFWFLLPTNLQFWFTLTHHQLVSSSAGGCL